MSKRAFFYTDPFAALWMVKTFRLKLLAGSFCLQPESIDAFLEMLGRGIRPERFVVSADSVPLLGRATKSSSAPGSRSSHLTK